MDTFNFEFFIYSLEMIHQISVSKRDSGNSRKSIKEE
jgi:hypothetical protein